MKEKLAFIDHSYHQKTRATHFLIDLLQDEYDVQLFWDHSWNGGPRIDLTSLAGSRFKKILFFQLIHYPEQELQHLRDKEVFICPMYDASPVQFTSYWKKFLSLPRIKFINFSKTLHQKLESMGFPCKYVQYFVPPQPLKKTILEGKLKGFFWQRTNQITWKQIRKLIPGNRFSNFNLHYAPDPPGYKLIKPSRKEFQQHNIQVTGWFREQQDYFNLLAEANVYFAPRYSEGIGMSFLEALAWGKCVVVPNRPTMNEYITHGENGILYDPHLPQPIDLTNIRNISKNAHAFSEMGYQKWREIQPEILDFFTKPLPASTKSITIQRRNQVVCKLEYLFYRLKELIKKKFPRSQAMVSRLRKFYR